MRERWELLELRWLRLGDRIAPDGDVHEALEGTEDPGLVDWDEVERDALVVDRIERVGDKVRVNGDDSLMGYPWMTVAALRRSP